MTLSSFFDAGLAADSGSNAPCSSPWKAQDAFKEWGRVFEI
jgi:hypothetical protein